MEIVNRQFKGEFDPPGKTAVDWYLLCYFLNKFRGQPLLELGVGSGGSLYTILSFSDDVTAVDNWIQNTGYKQTITADLERMGKSITLIEKESSTLTLDDLKTYAFIHLDANKIYEDSLADIRLFSEVCTGILCIDDYMNSMWPEVTWAVDAFLKDNPEWKIILIGNHQIFLSKIDVDIEDLKSKFSIITLPLKNSPVITFGNITEEVDPFIHNAFMIYSWHNQAYRFYDLENMTLGKAND